MFKPGHKKLGGRKKGRKNRRTQLLDEKAREGITPLDYMLQVMRDHKADPARRDEMARAAAPYLHARRAAEDRTGNVPPMTYIIADLEGD